MSKDHDRGNEGGKGKGLSYCGDIVHTHDRDRFLTALTAPPDRRESLFALYAFNHEVSKTAGVVSEPMLGQIRLQWWREAIDECYAGTPRRHAVVTALSAAIEETRPSRALFEDLIDKREADLDFAPPQTLADLENYAAQTSGGLTELALELISGVPGSLPETARKSARSVGTAWALVGLMRALPFHMRQRRGMLPRALAADNGVSMGDIAEGRNVPGIAATVGQVCQRATELLALGRGYNAGWPGRSASYGALSLGVLADGYLKQLQKVEYDVFNPRLAAPPALRGLSLFVRSFRGRY